MCGPEPAPRGLWWDVRRCPLQTETDAIQIETDAILDMADLLVTSGLAAAGYTLLAVGSCATIQSPTIRAAIQAYIVQRGLNIVFAPHGSRVKVPALAVPHLGSCTSSGCAWRLWAVRHSQEEAALLGSQPPASGARASRLCHGL